MVGVTADTNIYVSALVYGGKPLQLLEMAARGEVKLSVSEPIIEETVQVLRGGSAGKMRRCARWMPRCAVLRNW